MAAQNRKELVITGLRGRDGSTPSEIAIPAHKAKEMENVDLYRSVFARKRGGASAVFSSTTGEAFTDQLASLIRHVPANAESGAELWGVDADFVVQRLAGGTAFSTITMKYTLNANAYDVYGVSFNGKLWIFGNSATDRGQLWDGDEVRSIGFATPAAPTAANIGSGTYAAVTRYYKVAYVELSGSTVVRRSLSSDTLTFTPSGSGTHARITKPAGLSEGETHWELYVSADNNLFFELATTAVGTTTYDDNSDPFAAINNDPIPLAGAHTAPKSHKYGVVDGNRMLMAGRWESTNDSSRIWYTPRLGSGDGDDERVPDTVEQENWIDLDEKDGGCITALGGPFEGMPIAAKEKQLWGLRPTGSLIAPYQPLIISKVVGCLRQQSMVMAEDENGNPAIYFLSHRGPYRFGTRGLQYLGEDIKDIWFGNEDDGGSFAGVNLDATTVSCFGVHHADKHQIWWWVAEGTSNTPERILVFDTRLGEPDEDNQIRDGWTTFTGSIAAANCAVMFANTLAASMSRDLKPYIGTTGSSAVLLKGDTGELDNTTAFAGTVTLPEKHLAGPRHKCTVDQMVVLGSAGVHALTVTMHRDYGCEPREASVNMAKETENQTRSQKAIEAAYHADAKSIGARIGDVCPIAHPWSLDALVIQYEMREEIAI